ncbi:MAG: TolB family protein, partial [Sphingomonadales bacterium]
MSWISDKDLILSDGGKINRIDMDSGTVEVVPFVANVSREINKTLRTVNKIKEGTSHTRVQRWATPIKGGIISEALGDLYLYAEGSSENITSSDVLEGNPLYDAANDMLYYTTWTDRGHGAIYRRPMGGGAPEKLTSLQTQYGALSLSNDGKMLAYLQGKGASTDGGRLENQLDFELIVRDMDGNTHKVTDVNARWSTGNGPEIRRASPIKFSDDGKMVYFSEFTDDGLKLKRIGIDGRGEQELYNFPHSSRALISPDMKWIVFREYQRFFITPFEFVGKSQKISGENKMGFTKRVTTEEGSYLGWSTDSQSLFWTRGTIFYQKSISDILEDKENSASKVDIAVSYEVQKPNSTIAFTNARIITVDEDRQVLEGASILI